MSVTHHCDNGKSKPKTPCTPHGIPVLELDSSNKVKDATVINSSNDNSSDFPESPGFFTRQDLDIHPTGLAADEPKPPCTAISRTQVQLERDMNSVRSKFEGYQARADQQLDRMEACQGHFEKQQELVLKKLDTLINQTSKVASPTRPATGGKQVSGTYFVMAKDIQGQQDRDKAVEKILSEYQSPAVSFTRLVAKAGLGGVDKLTSNVPGFYYKHCQPDFFPAKFTGEDGYCKPYPHYNLSFANNHTWFSAFITLWRSMIPEDGSDFAAVSRKFTDRQILVLLHDGPFSSLAQAWKQENPSVHVEDDPVEKNAKKRAAARLDSKTLTRVSYHPQLPQLIVPRWNATWSKQVMSPELTDDEGGKWVKRPQWRAEWNIDIYDRIDGAERTKELAKPIIYSGKGKNKTIIKYPLAIFSKPWRKSPEGTAWMKASTHLINYKLKHKPDISGFLKAHPPLRPSTVEGEEEPEVVAYKGEAKGGDEVEVEAEVEDKDAGTSEGKEMEAKYYTADGDEFKIDPQLPSPLQAQPKARRPWPCVAPVDAARAAIPVNSVARTTLSMSPAPLPAPHIPPQPQYPTPGLDWDAAPEDPYQHTPGFAHVDPDTRLQSQHVPAFTATVSRSSSSSNVQLAVPKLTLLIATEYN